MSTPSGRTNQATSGIFRRKPIGADADGGLERSIGLWQLTAIGLGAIIGAGIFALAGPVAKTDAGPAVALSFLLAGVASACAALSYAEFGGLIPQAGSAYTYGYAVLGEVVGWFIGWDLLLEYTAIVAVVAIGVSQYISFLVQAMGIDLPSWMLGAPGTGDGHRIDLFAVLLCLGVAWLLNRGIKSSARVETWLVFVKIAIVIAVIVVGVFYVNTDNLTPYLPYGFSGVATGAATVFFAVFGYDAMSTAAEESKEAERILPKAVLLCLGVAWLLNRGIKSSARIETWLVFVKIAIVIAVIVVGAFYVNTDNLTPYLPYGFSGVATGAATVFFAVFGYDAMSTAAEESKEAERNLPKAIVLSLAIAMVLYLLASTVLTGMVKYTDLSETAAFSEAFSAVGLPAFAKVVAVGAIVGIVTVLFSFTLGASRIWYAISRDGLLPGWFTKTNRHRSPSRPVWIVGVVSAGIAGLVPIGTAAELTNIGILLAFVVVCGAVIVLRYRSPDLPRTFRVPLMPVVPLLGIGFSLWLVSQLMWETWVRFAIWFVIGIVVYAAYGYSHSKLGRGEALAGDPEAELDQS